MKTHLKPLPVALSLLLCAIFVQPLTIQAQSGSEIYRHITSRDGISNSFVWEMLQDQYGFIWIAGNNGLDRYDGYNAITFRNDPNDEKSIHAGGVFSLFEDKNGYIWVGTALGLSIYNPSDETFLQVRIPDSIPGLQAVRDISLAADGSIWAGAAAGLYRFSNQTPESETPEVDFFGFDESMESRPVIQTIEEIDNDLFWIGTNQGIYHFDRQTEEYTKPEITDETLDKVLSDLIWKILKDRNNNIWVTTEFGFVVWRAGEEIPEHVTAIGNGTIDLTNQYMQSIFEDKNGNLWIGTSDIGAFKYNPENDVIVTFRHESGNQNSITEDDVHYIFEDIDGNVWFGYHNIGISVMYMQPWQYNFNQLTENNDPTHPLNDIHHVIDDEEGNLWMATHQGLVFVSSGSGTLTSFLPDPQNTSAENAENHLTGFLYEGNRFLIGTHTNRFYVFDIESEQFTEIEIPEGIQLNFARVADESHYYLGTFGSNELVQVEKVTLKVNIIEAPRRDPDSSENRAVLPLVSPQGNIYIKYVYLETQNFDWDIFLFDPEIEAFTQSGMQSPAGISIFTPPLISKNDEGVLWLNSNRGLLREDVINNESRFLFQNNAGIISDSGGDILEDNSGFLWLGGSTGIIKLDPITETLTIYEADPDRKPIFFRSPSQLRNGDIVYSGNGGYVRFDPNQQVDDPTIQNIHITELRTGADAYSTLRSDYKYEIDHSNNNLSFTYLALNYRNPTTTRYRYRLIGYNDNWIEVGTQRSVFLANLPPGDYTFQVQAGQRYGAYSDATAELNVAILPPWWRTIPAYIAFFMIFIGGIFVVDKVQRKRVINSERERTREKELAQAREIEKAYKHLKSAQEQLVQQEKLASLGQLTAGIAHEIKNPLNFVNNFSEVSLELIEEAREEVRRKTEDRGPESSHLEGSAEAERRRGVSDEVQNKSLILEILDDIEANLRKIHEHGSRADGIVKSMLQHSRGGSGKMEPTNLNALIKEYVNLAFHGMRASKDPINVDIELDLDESVSEVPLISEDFSRVILNLCNNAFDAMREKQGSGHRVQGSGGYKPKLTVRTKSDNGKVMIEIEDNGPGIPDEIKDKILQPFFTTKKGTEGTGLGLSITHDIVKAHGGEIGIDSSAQGTKMSISLPLN